MALTVRIRVRLAMEWHGEHIAGGLTFFIALPLSYFARSVSALAVSVAMVLSRNIVLVCCCDAECSAATSFKLSCKP